MNILDISYSVWESVYASFTTPPPLHHVYGGTSGTHAWVHIYFGYDGKIFKAEVTGSDETDWSSTYSSSSTERASDDDAVAMIISETIDTPGMLIGFQRDLANVVRGTVIGQTSTAAATQAILRNTTYTQPSVVRGRSIRSADANDTSAGTGARTVKITYLRDDYTGPYEETVTMNGTSWVNTSATNIMYIEQVRVMTAGSGGQNAGIITLYDNTNGSGGANICTMVAGDNKLFYCHHFVATGRRCSLLNLTGSGDGVAGKMMVKWTPLTSNSVQEELVNARIPAAQQQSMRPLQAPVQLTGPGLLAGYIRPAAATAAVFYGQIDFYER